MEPPDYYDMYDDDFESQFADELDALRDHETDFEPVVRKEPIKNKITDKDAITAEETQQVETIFLSDFGNKPKKRERELEELFASLSDSDEELVIDEQLRLSPKRKKQRKNETNPKKTVTSSRDDDDFVITPPPSPTEDEKIMMRVNQLRSNNTEKPAAVVRGARKKLALKVTGSEVVLSRQPMGGFVSVTGGDGQRVYLRKKQGEPGKPACLLKQSKTRLLANSMSQLREQAELERQKRLMSSIDDRTSADVSTPATDTTENEPIRKQVVLWVDKYSPKHYTDLLSDDGINRNILYWLKLWDTCVFKRERVKREKNQKKEEKRNQNFKGNFKQNNFKATPEEILSEQKLDDHKRPELKVALLCGPPGLGKTTLAHVIAEHAGYNVIEMNASDDRSVEVFKRKLESATQMQSVLSRDNRPNCMLIDEIDGSPAATINVLIDYIKGPDSSKKKKKGRSILLRPIICICNDLYVPALRPLRQIAFVSHFPPTIPSRLASRLMQIATNNALKTDMTTLMTLCQKTENDIRSCLNTLQFIQKQSRSLSLSMVSSMSIGQKDQHKGLFTLWKDTFAMPRPQRKSYVNPHDASKNGTTPNIAMEDNLDFNPATPSSRFNNMLQAVTGNGDYDKLLSGIFENYLEVKFKDSHLDAVNHACDWLVFHDTLNRQILHSQNYILMRYLPFVPVVFHMMFASNAANKIHYPSAQFENMQKIAKVSNLLTSLCSEVSPYIKRNLNKEVAIMQVLPPLLTIIQPSLRPVNPQLFNTLEKQQMSSLVSSMIAYNLTYQQERSPEGQYNYVLDPNLEELVRFPGMPQVKQMTYAAKQLIAREIEVEKLRRSEETVPAPTKKSAATSKEEQAAKNKKKPAVPRHLEKLQPKVVVEEEDKPATDFFGRVITKKVEKSDTVTEEGDVMKKTTSLWYKFNEGFTNAIRKNIYIQELL